MIHEENKNQQPEKEDFSIENFLTDEKKQSFTEQQAVIHREDFAKPEVDEEAIMRVMAGEEPAETEHTKTPASNTRKMTYKPKKPTKEDYCGQFFKIPNSTASRGKSVYVRQEHHETFNRLINIIGIDKLTIYAYLDNIIEYHFQEFGELIREIYNEKHKPLF
ncbi:MAG: conjugal transfer protein TraB [Flavobacteriales bacterium 32-35-8]|nr:MAG: conjugal transfer protein TraB [Flavobacteriales bacterium 32-35-8]